MKIALLSDVHANLPALQSCLQEIDKHAPDAIYCLGDLVGYNVWPNEVIQLLRQHRIPCISGNYDHGIGHATGECGCSYKSDDEKQNGNISIQYTNNTIGENERRYLCSLPAHIRLEFKTEQGVFDLLLVHGSPRRNNEYLFEDRDKESFLRIFEQAETDILCFGHTHKPFHRILLAADGKTKHAINTGSVGKPKDGDPRGCFVLLNIDPKTAPEQIEVDFIRFPYDVETAATAVENSELPNVYAEALRKGK